MNAVSFLRVLFSKVKPSKREKAVPLNEETQVDQKRIEPTKVRTQLRFKHYTKLDFVKDHSDIKQRTRISQSLVQEEETLPEFIDLCNVVIETMRSSGYKLIDIELKRYIPKDGIEEEKIKNTE